MKLKKNSNELYKDGLILKKPLIILTGPTAVGKTSLSIQLAKAVGGEIISADSMQVYKGMDIGTAKIEQKEMQGIKHHLIDILSPEEEFNIVQFQLLAKRAMEEIYLNAHIPIIVGGTGFYIQSLVYDIDFKENDVDKSMRKALELEAAQIGVYAMHEKLRVVDEKSADEIHPNNIKKVIRALEFYYQTGEMISKHNEEERKKESPYNFSYFVLNQARDVLYERINQRIDTMIEKGLIAEVEILREKGYDKSLTSMQGLGYKEILDYLDGIMTREEAIFVLKRDTRHFAKRQLTWFKREKEVCWISKDDYRNELEILNKISLILKEKSIIEE
ncbi:MAG: tRNA (adenosine(37)-N6)-dimethylallyltransferase MiaA [Velocimicrobium sp.]